MAIKTRSIIPFEIGGKDHAIVRFDEFWPDLDTPYFTSDSSLIAKTLYDAILYSRHILLELKHIIESSGSHYYSRLMGISDWDLVLLAADMIAEQRLYLLVEPIKERTIFVPDIREKKEDLIDQYKSILYNSKEIINPRWKHLNDELAKSRPDTTFVGDKVLLKVDVVDIPNGTNLDFDVLSVGSGHERLISARGKVSCGVASVEWETVDPRAEDDVNEIRVLFSARSGNLESANCDIPIREIFGEIIDIDEEPIIDLPYMIVNIETDEIVEEGVTTEAGEIITEFSNKTHYVHFG